MRTTYNRQTRRAAECIRARSPRRNEPTHGDGLAQVAARIAEELDLSAEMIGELLSPADAAATTSAGSRPD